MLKKLINILISILKMVRNDMIGNFEIQLLEIGRLYSKTV